MQSSLYPSTQDILYKNSHHLTFAMPVVMLSFNSEFRALGRVWVYLLALQARLGRGIMS